MHALSLGTWWIHIASVLEWMAAMLAIQRFGRIRGEGGWRWLSLAMVPALASAMAACTWHLFDNSAELKGLVVLQAALTTVGNGALAIAAWNLLRRQRLGLDHDSMDPPPAAAEPAGLGPLQTSRQDDRLRDSPLQAAGNQAAGDRQAPAGAGTSPSGPGRTRWVATDGVDAASFSPVQP